MQNRIAMICSGRVGTALNAALTRAGYEVQMALKDRIWQTAASADVIILAVPFHAAGEVVRSLDTFASCSICDALTRERQAVDPRGSSLRQRISGLN